jgi:ADP-ribosylglycohydrolase
MSNRVWYQPRVSDRYARAFAALLGTSVGDSLGDQLFLRPADRRLPAPPWRWTDDTEMACSVLHVLASRGEIDQDALAACFAAHYDVDRGYGRGIETMMREVARGGSLRELAETSFGGTGSWGNGAAMRVAPLGAWFADDLVRAAWQADLSARVTHTHPEGVAGAVAVAVAAAVSPRCTPAELFTTVLDLVPSGEVREGIRTARDLPPATSPTTAAAVLGTGRLVSAADTVPLALWLAARDLDDYAEAVWSAAEVAEDVDTMCAIVGGIVASRVGVTGIPADWRQSTEPLPPWLAQP